MRTQSAGGWSTSFLATVLLPRIAGSLIPLAMYLESNGFQVDVGGLQSRALSGAIGFVLLHTRTGRKLALAGWLIMIVIIVLNLAYIEFARDTLKLLLMWLAMGALWFVNWRSVARRIIGRASFRDPIYRESPGDASAGIRTQRT